MVSYNATIKDFLSEFGNSTSHMPYGMTAIGSTFLYAGLTLANSDLCTRFITEDSSIFQFYQFMNSMTISSPDAGIVIMHI